MNFYLKISPFSCKFGNCGSVTYLGDPGTGKESDLMVSILHTTHSHVCLFYTVRGRTLTTTVTQHYHTPPPLDLYPHEPLSRNAMNMYTLYSLLVY